MTVTAKSDPYSDGVLLTVPAGWTTSHATTYARVLALTRDEATQLRDELARHLADPAGPSDTAAWATRPGHAEHNYRSEPTTNPTSGEPE